MTIPQGPNQRRSVDFLHDVLADGRRFRIFAAVDNTRECRALTVNTSISGARVIREIGKLAELRGQQCMIFSDNGTELKFPEGASNLKKPGCWRTRCCRSNCPALILKRLVTKLPILAAGSKGLGLSDCQISAFFE